MTSLPAGIFDKLSALEEVILTYNGDSQLDSGLFEHNPKLFITYLNGPNLSSVPSDLFEHNPGLKWVGVFDSELTSLPGDLLSGLSNLHYLKLVDNKQLSSLPADLLKRLPRFKMLDLSGNGLTSLPDGFFAGEYDGIRILKLHDNPVGMFHFRMEAEVVSHGVDADGFPTARVRYKIAEGAALTANRKGRPGCPGGEASTSSGTIQAGSIYGDEISVRQNEVGTPVTLTLNNVSAHDLRKNRPATGTDQYLGDRYFDPYTGFRVVAGAPLTLQVC